MDLEVQMTSLFLIYVTVLRKYVFYSTLFISDNKANVGDLIAATSLVILLKMGLKSSIFRSMWPSNLMDDLEKQ